MLLRVSLATMVEYKDRLAQALKDAAISVRMLADRIGVSYQAVKKVIDGKSGAFSAANNSKVAKFLSVNSHWLATGEGTKQTGDAAPSNVSPAPMGATRIPMINYVQAGIWTETTENFCAGDADDWLLTDLHLSSCAFALQIKGDSMLPEFKPGDRVIIDPEVVPLPGDFVVAKNCQEEATFKKYRPRGADADGNAIFELIPLNEDFESLRSDVTPIKIVGTMVEHRKYRRRQC